VTQVVYCCITTEGCDAAKEKNYSSGGTPEVVVQQNTAHNTSPQPNAQAS